MRTVKNLLLGIILLTPFSFTFSQLKKDGMPPSKVDNSLDSAVVNYKKQQRSITYGSVTVEGKPISYQAVAGSLVFKNSSDTPLISMSYDAYFKTSDDASQRPITFIYNGK